MASLERWRGFAEMEEIWGVGKSMTSVSGVQNKGRKERKKYEVPRHLEMDVCYSVLAVHETMPLDGIA